MQFKPLTKNEQKQIEPGTLLYWFDKDFLVNDNEHNELYLVIENDKFDFNVLCFRTQRFKIVSILNYEEGNFNYHTLIL